jgi:TolA-binding protein
VQVRLITTRDDPYSWKVLPGREHLFAKQMSKHSIGAYMELFREVGASFEAVLATAKATDRDQGSDGRATFSGTIAELERHKSSLMQELCQSESRAERAEREIDRLKTEILALERQDAMKADLINQYRNITVKSLENANSAFEKYRLSALASKGDREWSGLLGNAYSSGSQGDEEYTSLD